MELLNRFPRQLTDWWCQSSVKMRGSLIAFTTIAIVVAVAIAHWKSRPQYDILFENEQVSPSELSAMESALAKARLNEAQISAGHLRVPRDQKDIYLKTLADANVLPAAFFSHTERMLRQDTPFHSQRQRDALWKLAKERELALMLRKMSGVEDVSVQYDESETSTFPKRRERRATVAVRAAAGRSLDEPRIRAIRRTVMNSVGVTDEQAITVLDLNAGVAYSREDDLAAAPTAATAETDYSAVQRRFEESYADKIRQRLSMYPGMVVTVNVELDAAGQSPRHVAASIGIPQSGLRREWYRRGKVGQSLAPPNPQSLVWKRFEEENRRAVEAAVVPLLPPPLVVADQPRCLTIETFDDGGTADVVASLNWPALSAWTRDHSATLLGMLGGLLAIGWLTHSLKATSRHSSTEEPTAVSNHEAASMDQDTEANFHSSQHHHEPISPERFSPDREDLRQELANRVHHDPRLAAKRLQRWLASRS